MSEENKFKIHQSPFKTVTWQINWKQLCSLGWKKKFYILHSPPINLGGSSRNSTASLTLNSASPCFFFCSLADLCVNFKLLEFDRQILADFTCYSAYSVSCTFWKTFQPRWHFFTKTIPGRDSNPSSACSRIGKKRNIRGLKCCHLIFERVNSSWKITNACADTQLYTTAFGC